MNSSETCNSDLNQKCCQCPCHKMKGIWITLIGLVFLLGNLEILGPKFVGISWPILLMLLGVSKVCSKMCRCCKSG